MLSTDWWQLPLHAQCTFGKDLPYMLFPTFRSLVIHMKCFFENLMLCSPPFGNQCIQSLNYFYGEQTERRANIAVSLAPQWKGHPCLQPHTLLQHYACCDILDPCTTIPCSSWFRFQRLSAWWPSAWYAILHMHIFSDIPTASITCILL